MKAEMTSPSPVRRVMAVEVGPDEVARETEVVLRGYQQKAKLPGFCPGRAPLALVRSRLGKDVEAEVRERVVARCFRDAAREHGVEPIGDPVLDEIVPGDENGLRFRVSFEVLPAIELRGHRGIDVTRPRAVVGEAEVDRTIEELWQAHARLVPAEGRVAATGDVVVCDLDGTPSVGEPFRRERMLIEIGGPGVPPALTECLIGATAGAEVACSVEHPEADASPEVAGRTVRYAIRVREVRLREVPALDDEFAKDLGEFEDLAALRTRVRSDLEARAARETDRRVRQAVLDEVLLRNPIVLPEGLVDAEIHRRLEQVVRTLVARGVDPQKVELDWKALRDAQIEPARRAVHARLILDAVTKIESVTIDPAEIDERIRRDAEALGENPAEVRQRIASQGGMDALRAHLYREKALDLLTSVANIRDEVH
jgi:trigger factor